MRYISISNELHFFCHRETNILALSPKKPRPYTRNNCHKRIKKTGRKPIISLDQGHRNGSVCHSVSLIK